MLWPACISCSKFFVNIFLELLNELNAAVLFIETVPLHGFILREANLTCSGSNN